MVGNEDDDEITCTAIQGRRLSLDEPLELVSSNDENDATDTETDSDDDNADADFSRTAHREQDSAVAVQRLYLTVAPSGAQLGEQPVGIHCGLRDP